MYLNYSRVSLFKQCRRKWAFTYFIDGGRRLAHEIEVFSIGSAVHKGLEWLALNVAKAAEKAFAYYIEARSKNWDGAVLEEWNESADLVRRMVSEYARTEWDKHDFSIVSTEKSFAVVLGEVCWSCGTEYKADDKLKCSQCGAEISYWVGTIDLLVNRKQDGSHDRYAILDHKTTGSTPSDQFLSAFSRSFQLLGYVYGAEKDSGLSIKEYGVNALQKAKTIGTDAAEIKTCGDCRNGKIKVKSCSTCHMTGKVSKKVKLEPFRRKWFSVDPSDIDRFVLWAHRAVKDIAAEIELFKTEPEIAFPMNDRLCNFGPCEFLDACWNNKNALQWYAPPEELLDGLVLRGEDYVDAHRIASEEVA